jgi:hypothetical protein
MLLLPLLLAPSPAAYVSVSLTTPDLLSSLPPLWGWHILSCLHCMLH